MDIKHYLRLKVALILSLFLLSPQSGYGIEEVVAGDLEVNQQVEYLDDFRVPDLFYIPSFNAWIEAYHAKDELRITESSRAVKEKIDLLGTKNLFPISDMATLLATKTYKDGNYSLANTLIESAILFAPDNHQAWFLKGKITIATDSFNFKEIANSFLTGSKILLQSKLELRELLEKSAARIYLVLIVTFYLLLTILIAINIRVLIADFTSMLPGYKESIFKSISGALILLLPLAYGGPLLFLLASVVLVFPLIRLKEKSVIFLFAGLLFVLPFTIDLYAKSAIKKDMKLSNTFSKLASGSFDLETTALLTSLYEKSGVEQEKGVYGYALGVIAFLQEEYSLASRLFRESISLISKQDMIARGYNNLGVIDFRAGRYDNAINNFKKSIELDSKSWITYYNLSNAYLETVVNNSKAEAAYQRALELNSEGMRDIVSSINDKYSNKAIPILITNNDLKHLNLSDDPLVVSSLINHIWKIYLYPITKDKFSYIAFGFLILLILVWLLSIKRYLYQSCSSCSDLFQPDHQGLPEVESICDQCNELRSMNRSIDATATDQKRASIKKYTFNQALISSILDKIYPGVGRLYEGCTISGAITLFISNNFAFHFISLLFKESGESLFSYNILIANSLFFIVAITYWIAINSLFRRIYS
ncbi:MAG: tetratricopeptide repeat protein [Nitrospinota bacterium]